MAVIVEVNSKSDMIVVALFKVCMMICIEMFTKFELRISSHIKRYPDEGCKQANK